MDEPVAVVTGGAQGIGAATAHRLSERGVHVYIVDVAADAGHATCREINENGGSATFVEQDLLAPGGPGIAVGKILEATGSQLDILINNAYFYEPGEMLVDLPSNVLMDHLQRLTVSYHEMVTEARGSLANSESGAIVNLASVHAWLVGEGFGSYSMAKAAVSQMTRVLASELGPEGIRVNAVAPGLIETAKTMARSQSHRDRLAHLHPLRRIGTPDEVGRAITFLALADSNFITGHVLVVDGGVTVQLPIHTARAALEFEVGDGQGIL